MKTNELLLKKSLTKIVSLCAMGMISITSVFSVFAGNRRVDIFCDGKSYSINTGLESTESILELQNIKVSSDDIIIRDDVLSLNAIKITIKRAYEVPVIADGTKSSVMIAEGRVQDVISRAGILLGRNDQVTPPLDTELFNGINIEVTRKKKVTFSLGGVKGTSLLEAFTVEEFLESKNISLNKTDELNVNLEDALQDDMEIVLNRISYSDENVYEEIPFESIIEKDNSLEEGCTRVKSEGVVGTKEIVIHKKIVNGEVVEESKEKETIIKDPQTEIKVVGTKKKVIPKNSTEKVNVPELSYSRKLVGECTAYTADPGARTATGELAALGRVAVDPNIIPYGSKLYICSEDGSFIYGFATASDTGGALKSGRVLVDLFFPTEGECINFGRRNLTVYVL